MISLTGRIFLKDTNELFMKKKIDSHVQAQKTNLWQPKREE